MYPVAWAGMFALVVGAALALFWQHIGLRMGFLFEAAAFGFAAFLLDVRPLHLALVPRRVKQARARAMAHREFAASILAAQNPAGGLVLFASLGERYVEIVADRIVHARVGEAAWNAIVSDFTSRAKKGAVADAFVEAIEACAAHLEEHFPKTGPMQTRA
jgi:putative membrane protein